MPRMMPGQHSHRLLGDVRALSHPLLGDVRGAGLPAPEIAAWLVFANSSDEPINGCLADQRAV